MSCALLRAAAAEAAGRAARGERRAVMRALACEPMRTPRPNTACTRTDQLRTLARTLRRGAHVELQRVLVEQSRVRVAAGALRSHLAEHRFQALHVEGGLVGRHAPAQRGRHSRDRLE